MEALATCREAPQSETDRLEKIYRDHHRQVFNAAYRVTGNAQDAEDVLQTVFVRLLRRKEGAPLSESPAGYLHRAAVNAALDVVRSRASARSTPLEDVETRVADSAGARPDAAHADRELRDRVRQALARVNPKAAEIFVLRYFEGYGNHEIAKMVGSSRSTIGVILHRTRHRLREEMSTLAGGTP